MRKKVNIIVIAVLFLAGLSVLLYPFVANQWNSYRQSRLMSSYEEGVAEKEAAGQIDYEAEWEKARIYNDNLMPMILPDSFAVAEASDRDEAYMACLNINGDEVMGIVEIPKIDVELPIYHTTDEEVLQIGAGHLEGSSLPVGGESTHAVISAHRGLPSAKLFTDLDQMAEGDVFYLHILDETLAYEVDQILPMVDKDDTEALTEALAIEEGKDYVTLFTCTPYGVNTHRLLVRGVRTEYNGEEERPETPAETVSGLLQDYYMFFLLGGVAVTALAIAGIRALARKKEKKRGWTAGAGSPAGNRKGGYHERDNAEDEEKRQMAHVPVRLARRPSPTSTGTDCRTAITIPGRSPSQRASWTTARWSLRMTSSMQAFSRWTRREL